MKALRIVAVLFLGAVISWPTFKPLKVERLTAGPTHRYSFNEAATNHSIGMILTDSIGKAHGRVLGDGARCSGTRLILPGGTSESAAYVELPRGLLSANSTNAGGTGEVSIEGWIKITGNRPWSRIFDFGATRGAGARSGRVSAPGGTGEGIDYLMYAQEGDRLRRIELRDEDPPGGGTRTVDMVVPDSFKNDSHFVVTWKEQIGEIRVYENTSLLATMKVSSAISDVADLNVWLGRSQYGVDENLEGELDEFRIYDHVLTIGEIRFNEVNGPDRLIVPPPQARDDQVALNPGRMVLIPVMRNDRGTGLDPNSLRIVNAPHAGSAQVTNGKILYTNNGLSTTFDQFAYTVQDSLGNTSSVATVLITIDPSIRLAGTTITIPNRPPPNSYEVVDAFHGLKFQNPMALRFRPKNSKELFVAERHGIIALIPDVTAANPERREFLNITNRVAFNDARVGELGLQSMAFHPGFDSNGWVFVFYTAPGTPYFLRVSRFNVLDNTQAKENSEKFALNADHEEVLMDLQQVETNHIAGDLHFGPDGYLYASFGDGGGQMNRHQNAQRIDKDFFSGIIRIDVDKRPSNYEPHTHPAVIRDNTGKALYSVPYDNPFVNVTTFNGLPIDSNKVRSEFWAVGFRNPWRMSFDPRNGELWVGDVGQDTYEEIDIVRKGGNYGWAFREGFHVTPNTRSKPISTPPNSFSSIDPVWEYVHSVQSSDASLSGNAVIGGIVSEGSRIPEIANAYIFGDFESGNIWALHRTNHLSTVERLTSDLGVSAFGVDPSNGDVLLANYLEDRVDRLVRTDITNSDFPARLSDTGIFADIRTLTPNPGINSYEPIVSFWSDHATKRRWFTIPGIQDKITFAPDSNWSFPTGMKWIKHFDLELERGHSQSKRRIETRVLVKTEGGIYGVSYRWNETQTDALLVDDGGENFSVTMTNGAETIQQQWEIPSRAACSACHTAVAGYALSFNTREINQVSDINGILSNEISTLSLAGYFNIPVTVDGLPAFASAGQSNGTIEERVRSYLAVNCVQCHQPGGTAPGTWDARPQLSLVQTGLINGNPKNNDNDSENKLVVPGNPRHSVLLLRVKGEGFSRMPPLSTHQVDQAAINLLQDWIEDMH